MNSTRRLHKTRNWNQQRRRKSYGKDTLYSRKRKTDKYLGYAMHRDRKGRAINLLRWARLQGRQFSYTRIGDTFTKRHRVSTIWTGLDGGMSMFFGGSALIFESMIFCTHGTLAEFGWSDEESRCEIHGHEFKHGTDKNAKKGHNQIVHGVRELEKKQAMATELVEEALTPA